MARVMYTKQKRENESWGEKRSVAGGVEAAAEPQGSEQRGVQLAPQFREERGPSQYCCRLASDRLRDFASMPSGCKAFEKVQC